MDKRVASSEKGRISPNPRVKYFHNSYPLKFQYFYQPMTTEYLPLFSFPFTEDILSLYQVCAGKQLILSDRSSDQHGPYQNCERLLHNLNDLGLQKHALARQDWRELTPLGAGKYVQFLERIKELGDKENELLGRQCFRFSPHHIPESGLQDVEGP